MPKPLIMARNYLKRCMSYELFDRELKLGRIGFCNRTIKDAKAVERHRSIQIRQNARETPKRTRLFQNLLGICKPIDFTDFHVVCCGDFDAFCLLYKML
jgi:hypothetical protein